MFDPGQHSRDVDVAEVWRLTLHSLREHYNLNPRQLAVVGKAKPLTFLDNNVFIAVAHESARTYLENNIREELGSALSEVFGFDVGFGVHIDPSLDEDVIGAAAAQASPGAEATDGATYSAGPVEPTDTSGLGIGHAPPPIKSADPPLLNPNYTFKSFVTGDSNRMAHATAFAVAEGPAKSYNPLFIYGGSGLGKTHLLHAIGHYAYNLYPNLKVKYVNAEQFFTDYINSIAAPSDKPGDGMSAFRRRYRDIDILLIDDIQFLGGKEKGLEEFFHTFEALYGSLRQIVITSDLPPQKLSGFEERYVSRFQWGVISNVQKPELETRIAILQRKAENQKLVVGSDVLNFIASKIVTNIRELEGALTRVRAYASLSDQPITVALAEDVLRDVMPEGAVVEVSATDIMDITAKYFSLTVDDLKCKSRLGSLVEARSIAMYLCRELTPLSFPDIAKLFNRDHSTVMAACKKITTQLSERVATYNQVSELMSRIKQRQSGA